MFPGDLAIFNLWKTVSGRPLPGLCYFFIFGWKMRLARYPNTSAAEIPTALAVKPPLKIPRNPSESTAFYTPFQSTFPKPSRGTEAPAPAYS